VVSELVRVTLWKTTMSRRDNLYFKFKMSAVTASMTDAEIERLSDGNGRMLTSLMGQRERLRDPVLDRYCRCFDHWHALFQQWRQTADEEIWQEQERAHRAVVRALDALDERDKVG
jgi:hypothetical protein